MIAAFGLDEIHQVFGGGIKNLIFEHDCCLWSWRASSGLRRRHQIPASEASLLPLVLAGFMGLVKSEFVCKFL